MIDAEYIMNQYERIVNGLDTMIREGNKTDIPIEGSIKFVKSKDGLDITYDTTREKDKKYFIPWKEFRKWE